MDYLTVHIADYNIRLKKFLNVNGKHLEELHFCNIEIEETEREVFQKRNELKKIMCEERPFPGVKESWNDYTGYWLNGLEQYSAWLNNRKSELLSEHSRKSKPAKKKKPSIRLIDYLDTADNRAALIFIKKFKGQKGKNIAYLIHALNSIKALRPADLTVHFEAVKSHLGDIGSYEAVRKVKIPTQSNQKNYDLFKSILFQVVQNIKMPSIL